MRGEKFVFVLGPVVFATVILAWSWMHSAPMADETAAPPVSPSPSSQAPIAQSSPQEWQPPGGPYQPSDPRWVEVNARDKVDRAWEWKIPLSFYGSVVDEDEQPVSGAEVHFQWTNLSVKGTGESDTKTNEKGLFSLENVTGKRLLVRVTKPGYYSFDSRNRLSFEYANPFEEIFHRPSASAPVVYHLRKQGLLPQLISKSLELMLPGDGTTTGVHLESGKTNPTGELRVQAWKPWPPRPMSPPYDWRIVLFLDGGGFVETSDDFPFLAPETAYNPTYTVDMPASLHSQWRVSVERTLYFQFGEPKRYGRLSFRTDGNSRYMFLHYVINPTGDRNLEEGKASQ